MITTEQLAEWRAVCERLTDEWDDPDFVCAARSALPALLDEVECLRALLCATCHRWVCSAGDVCDECAAKEAHDNNG